MLKESVSNDLEQRIAKIEQRNQRVEMEKAWETSWVRRISIAILTYLVLAGYFGLILKVNPWTNAIVPTIGFLLSTLSLSLVKKIWLNANRKT